MLGDLDFDIEVSFGCVQVSATADLRWKNGRWDYDQININSVCDDQGNSVERILLPTDYSQIYLKASEIVEHKLDCESSDDPWADDERDLRSELQILVGE